jgi:hypothetical protein
MFREDWKPLIFESLQIPVTAMLLSLAADPVTCVPPSAPNIKVIPKASPIEYVHDWTMEELTARGTDTISPYPRHAVTKTGGTTASEIQLETGMKFQHQTYPDLGVGCIYYNEIKLTISLNQRVYIAKDYSKNSCEYREILEHEKKHVRIDREIVNKYAAKIGEALRLSINNALARGPYPVNRLPQIQSDMRDYIASVVKTQQSLMEEERFRRQQAIDTFEEYERVRQACE